MGIRTVEPVANAPDAEPKIPRPQVPANLQRWDTIFVIILFAAAIAKLWLLPLRNGFWLDETGTAWAASGRLKDVYNHTIAWPSQTPLYSLICWVAIQIGGMHEIVLRLPSLVGMLIGVFALYRIGLRLLNREAAIIAALGCICSEAVYFAAADARPYALGTAGVIISTYYLIDWLDRRRMSSAIYYALALSFTIHMQYVFGTVVALHAVYAAARGRRGQLPPPGQCWLSAGIFAATLAFAIPHFVATFITRRTHSFVGPPVVLDLWSTIAPALLLGSVLLAVVLVACVHRIPRFHLPSVPFSTGTLIAAWAVLPGLLLFLASVLLSLGLFMPRYTLTAVPGVALLVGWLVSALEPKLVRRLVASCIVVAAIFSSGGLLHPSHAGDWRRAVQVANSAIAGPETPVLVRSGFIESAFLDYHEGAPHSDELFAPLVVYPLRGKLIRLSYGFGAGDVPYLRDIASSSLTRVNRFVFITSGDDSYEYWLLGHLSEDGFHIERTTRVGGAKDTLRVLVFGRRS